MATGRENLARWPGWFTEVNDQWPGQAMALEVDEVLYEEKSQYQDILVFKSKTWGNVLVLDGVIQLTERDEMSYQEMITHLPLFAHSNPEHVLIIGGGDGGVIREVVKHSSVKSVTICEIDDKVIAAGKKYFPSVAAAWDDPRLTVFVGDGAEFMKRQENLEKFDVIITDSSDPIGPAQSLFETPFYRAMYNALRPGGKICTQAESMWIHLDLIEKLVRDALAIFANAEYGTVQIPTYPAGQIGLLVCSKANPSAKGKAATAATTAAKPARKVHRTEQDKYRFYTSELHEASFVLPKFVQNRIDTARAAAEATRKAEAKASGSGKKSKQAPAAAEEVTSPKKAKTDETA